MKPKRNKPFCYDCGRRKMVFESEKKANTFIKFNSTDIESENGFAPKRSYFCIACNSWHVTSKEEVPEGKSITEQVLEIYKKMEESERVKQNQNVIIPSHNHSKKPSIKRKLYKVFCIECGKRKTVFKSKNKARPYHKFKSDAIKCEKGYTPQISYYCIACKCWHITSKKEIIERNSRTEQVFEPHKQCNEPEIVRMNHNEAIQILNRRVENKRKENIFKETKAKREQISEILSDIEANIRIIEIIMGENDNYCLEIINDSYSKIQSINDILTELEIVLKEVLLESEIKQLFEAKQKRKNEIENRLETLAIKFI